MDANFELNKIKIEKDDELLHYQFTAINPSAKVKEENGANNEFADVIYQSLPWEEANVKKEQLVRPSLVEVDENMVIETEIKVEESVVEITAPQFSTSSKKTKSKQNGNNNRLKIRKKTNKPQKKQYQCECCPENFTKELRLISHHRRHADQLPFACRVCTKRFFKAEQKTQHESGCTMRRFECHLCRFTSLQMHLNRFLVHWRKHTGEKPFSCKCCAKLFSSKRMLNFHMKYHPNEFLSKLQKCSFCQRKFATSAEAKKHETSCSLQRKFQCYVCKSLFTYMSSLRRHMPQHTGLTAFNCKYCTKGYVRKEYLDLHLKTAHNDELKYPCTICKQRFQQQSDVDKHMQSCTKKTVFKCELCNYTTVSKIYAEDHKQKHIGSDEFKCLHCSAVFLQRSKLVHHVKTHNKKSKFQCPHCPKAYHRWLFMEKHRKICTFTPSSSQ